MSEIARQELLDLVQKTLRNDIPKEYTSTDAQNAIRQELINLNGGSTTLNPRTFRPGTELFALIETLVDVIKNEGLKGDEFWNQFVDYRNVAEGNQNLFYTEDDSLFIVSEIGGGNQAFRRQRLTGGTQLTVPTSIKGARIYEHLQRILAGRVDFNELTIRVGTSLAQKRYETIADAFISLNSATDGLYADVWKTGTYSETDLLNIIDHVEADNGTPAKIIGTRAALRNLKMTDTAEIARQDLYNVGYYGRFYGTPTYVISQRNKANSHNFLFPNDQIWIVAGEDKFIKFVTEGETWMHTVDPANNMDLTQEYVVYEQYGAAVLLGRTIGSYTMTTAAGS